mmetsp:Transcript_84691/g.220656  ORF Transcript_84691/g.220656 Transcript_84691/m.220656 type:complete len:215 (+) Transcript_84691:777-1421(+)
MMSGLLIDLGHIDDTGEALADEVRELLAPRQLTALEAAQEEEHVQRSVDDDRQACRDEGLPQAQHARLWRRLFAAGHRLLLLFAGHVLHTVPHPRIEIDLVLPVELHCRRRALKAANRGEHIEHVRGAPVLPGLCTELQRDAKLDRCVALGDAAEFVQALVLRVFPAVGLLGNVNACQLKVDGDHASFWQIDQEVDQNIPKVVFRSLHCCARSL